MAESAVRSYCIESQKLLREATPELGARSYCIESQKLLREATPEFGARSYCIESQKRLREATPEFRARSYCTESQKLLRETTPEFGARSYCIESQKLLREATPEFGARSYCVESQKLLREATPEFGARSYCIESQKRLREATPEFGARSYCVESQKLLREATPEFDARSYCIESQKLLREATPEFRARSYCVESQKLLHEATPEFGARSYCVESQKLLREATPEFGARSYCVESQKLLREAKPVKRRLSSILCAAVVATGSCVLITLHIFVTLSSLDVDAPPHSFITNKDILEEHALKFRSMGHVKEKRSELANLDPHSAQKQNFKEFVMEYFLEMAEKFHQTRVDCASLLAGDQKSIKRAVGISKVLAGLERIKHGESGRVAKLKGREAIPPPPKLIKEEVRKWPPWEFQRLTNLWYLKATLDCMTFKQTRGYVLSPLTPEEEEFPIAFSLIVYKDIEMVERILRSVYRPQNSYCIHVDLKADPQFYAAAEAVASCFRENVRMSSRRVAVKWGTYTTLEPELICMRDLLDMDSGQGSPRDVKKRKKPEWKYFINLTGQDFPLKTNFELVKILTAFGGANNEEGTLEK